MMKTVAILIFLQVSGLLVTGYVHDGERGQEDEKTTSSLQVLMPVLEDDGNSPGDLASESDSPNVVERQGLFASQETDLESPTSVTLEPNWLATLENADEYLDNWDGENEGSSENPDPTETNVVDSSEAVPLPVNGTEDEFSNVVYDISRTTDALEDGEPVEENEVPDNEPENDNVVPEESELDQFEIKPYTVEPRFEEAIKPQLPEAPPTQKHETKYVTTVGGTDTWGDFSLDDFQGRKRMEEDMKTEVSREPLRPVHRSPVPWLQRDVNQVGQPRQSACQMELDRGIGPDEVSSWYYDNSQMRCRWFGYRGYGGNANRFASRAACEAYCIKDMSNLCEAVRCSWTGTQCALVSDQSCMDSAKIYGRDWRTKCPPEQPVCMSRRSTRIAPDIDFRSIPLECLQDKDPGSCQRRNPSVMFHYDRERNDCMTFYFHDCAGNDNRFETKSDCMTHCSP